MSWAHSPTYGTTVVLGPTQEAVYRFVLGETAHGRRPSYTLATIAQRTGKPVSSVHEALGRLRALGLIGFAASMGRTGGHRLWRVAGRARGTLDAIRHRWAIARITRRWYRAPLALTSDTPAPEAGTLWSGAPHETGPAVTDPAVTDEDRQAPSSFREGMARAGFAPWWRLAEDDHNGQGDRSCDPSYAECVGS